jgi:hypothetical protein
MDSELVETAAAVVVVHLDNNIDSLLVEQQHAQVAGSELEWLMPSSNLIELPYYVSRRQNRQSQSAYYLLGLQEQSSDLRFDFGYSDFDSRHKRIHSKQLMMMIVPQLQFPWSKSEE